jgi:hypothetical protein
VVVLVLLLPQSFDAYNDPKQWLRLLVPLPPFFILYGIAHSLADRVVQSENAKLMWQFDLSVFFFFAAGFVWIAVGPGKNWPSAVWEKAYAIAMILIGLFLAMYAIRFLHLLKGASYGQTLSSSQHVFLKIALTLYLLAVAKILLPSTVSRYLPR